MSIELQAASTEEIAEFKQAAAAEYKKLGIPPKLADYAFNRYMAKMASQMGMVQPPPERIQKLAEKIKPLAEQLKTSGADERGKRDGTGPHKDSAQAKAGKKGKRQEAGEECPAPKKDA
jgi:hypothetical protein